MCFILRNKKLAYLHMTVTMVSVIIAQTWKHHHILQSARPHNGILFSNRRNRLQKRHLACVLLSEGSQSAKCRMAPTR
jgi:hypothetical protein